MATLEERANGSWQAKIRRKGQPAQSKTFDFKKDAEAWARDVENKMDRGIFQDRSDAERMTVGELINLFVKEFAPENYRVREDKKEAWRFQCAHLKKALGKYSLAALDQKAINKYRDDRQKPTLKKFKSGLEKEVVVSGSTVRKELFMLSKIMGYAAIELEIVLPRGNPTKLVRKPSEGRGRERRLSGDELSKLFVECRASRNIFLLPAVELAIETGMRQSELLALTWKNVDLVEGLARIEKSKTDNDEEQGRVIALSDRAIEIFKLLPRDFKNKRVIPLARMTLYHAYVAALKRAGIEDFDFHDLRHEALSRLGEQGSLSTREMMQQSGHRTPRMVMKYQHADVKKIREKFAKG